MIKKLNKYIFIFLVLIPTISLWADIDKDCSDIIDQEFKKIQDRKAELDSATYRNNLELSWEKKASIISYNYRNFACQIENICISLEDYMFGNIKKNQDKTELPIIWCTKYEIDIKKFNSCAEKVWREITIFRTISKYCNIKKEEIIINEKNRMTQEYETYSMQNKSYFISAKLLSMSTKMRDLSVAMTKLRSYFEKIINKVTCKQS